MLTVYKASAGSGKTFRLAVEYIKHLVISPVCYDGILAVTFTNKATEEMKTRILSHLYGIANSLADSQVYLDVMLPELQRHNEEAPFTDRKVDEAFVRQMAGMALHNLLHNYHLFRVETIDKFFQTVLRNLARELDLTPNLRVEIRDTDVVDEAVDRWIDKLTEDDRQMTWITEYIRHTMDDEKSWNIIGKIKSFGRVLLCDEYKALAQELNEAIENTDFTAYIHSLRKTITTADKVMHEEGERLWDLATRHGIDEKTLTQKEKGVGGFMSRMRTMRATEMTINSYVAKALDTDDTEADAWVGKKGTPQLREVCRKTLKPALLEAMERIIPLRLTARSAKVTLDNLSALRMLHAIESEIWQNNREQNTFLLSDTQTLLSRMIGSNDSPFVFEKIGAHLQNIMIDEFQDTSTIQWKNFRVLLDDCMSRGNRNLIVGDVKQSIYRWRSGDWRLLNNIEQAFGEKELTVVPLKTNRRSAENVIRFNNIFFTKAIGKLTEGEEPRTTAMLKKAYADVVQDFPANGKEEGHVEIRLFDRTTCEDDTVEYVTETITQLVEKGVKQSDIAVLARTRGDIETIVTRCMEQFATDEREEVRRLRFISDEAFLLCNAATVNILVDAIRCLVSKDDRIALTRLAVAYGRTILRRKEPYQRLVHDMLLPEEYRKRGDELSRMPLYQLCEHLCILFSLTDVKGEAAHLCSFFDNLCDFTERNIADAATFLKYWDEVMYKKKIESNADDGLRILTIHKSKGLEYRNVIIPFCDWQLEKETLVWCHTEDEPFSILPAIPVSVKEKNLEDTVFYKDYLAEHIQNTVDNINLLYVAFTRAVDNLFITAKKGQKEGYRGWLIENIMKDVGKETGAETGDDTLDLGELLLRHESRKPTENIFLMPAEPMPVNIRTNIKDPVFRESNKSVLFTASDDDEEAREKEKYITLGNILHNLFANIRTTDDVATALLQLEHDGILYGGEVTHEAIDGKIKESMKDERIRDWFSGRWTLFNECTILEYDAKQDTYKEHRPDRVMTNGEETIVVDFKLYALKKEYHTQVGRYMRLLKEMGHKKVRGFLWAIMSGKVVEVEGER